MAMILANSNRRRARPLAGVYRVRKPAEKRYRRAGDQRDQDLTAITVAHKREAMQKVGVVARETAPHPGMSDIIATARAAEPPTITPAAIALSRRLECQGLPASMRRAWAVRCEMEIDILRLIVPVRLLRIVG